MGVNERATLVLTPALSQYFARVTIDRIRAGLVPTPEVCKGLNQYPLVDDVRQLLGADDWPTLRQMVESTAPHICAYALTLVRAVQHLPEVDDYLWALDLAKLPAPASYALVFRRADSPKLTSERSVSLREYLHGDWTSWQQALAGFASKPVDYCRNRLADETTPAGKRWLYLYVAAGTVGPARAGAQALIRSFLNDPDPVLGKIAKDLCSNHRLAR